MIKSVFRRGWFRFLAGSTLLLVGLMLSGTVYQSVATAKDMADYPAPGEIVSVNGADTHIYCIGSGSPTVIFDAGAGGTYLDWVLVQPEIANHTRACAYDRSGMGYSDYAGKALDTWETAERLHQLLDEANIEGPYLLVGHSYGGIHMRTFAHLYPTEVMGMVLVDSAHENQMLHMPADALKPPFIVDMIFKTGPFLSRIGVFRALSLAEQFIQSDHLTTEQHARSLAVYNRSDFWMGTQAENVMSILDTSQSASPASLGDLPLVVISQGSGAGEGLSQEVAEEVSGLWPRLQRELAALSTNSTHITAEGASHYVQIDKPQVVIDGILSLIPAS